MAFFLRRPLLLVTSPKVQLLARYVFCYVYDLPAALSYSAFRFANDVTIVTIKLPSFLRFFLLSLGGERHLQINLTVGNLPPHSPADTNRQITPLVTAVQYLGVFPDTTFTLPMNYRGCECTKTVGLNGPPGFQGIQGFQRWR